MAAMRPIRWPTNRRLPPAVAAPIGLALLILANASLNDQRLSILTAIALVAGLSLWALTARGMEKPPKADLQGHVEEARVRWWALGIAVGLATVTWWQSAGNTFRPLGVAAWVASCAAWTIAWWPAPIRRPPLWPSEITATISSRLPATLRGKAPLLLVLGLIVAVSVAAHFYRLEVTPRDPTSDHAEKHLDVKDVLDGQRPIYFERNTGREPGQFYVTAALIRVLDLPNDFTTLKIGTALVGVVTIPFVYLLAAEIGGRLTGLAAAFLYAMGKWPVAIARYGLRFAYAPLAAAVTFWLLLRWLRTGDRRDALACGLSLGIGLYGYTPFRLAVPAIALAIGASLLNDRRDRRQILRQGLLLIGTASVVFVPLAAYMTERPDMYWYRSVTRVAGEEGGRVFGTLTSNLSIFLRNNLNATLAFNWRGDTTYVNMVHLDPWLDVVTGALLLAGLAVVAVRIALWRDTRFIALLAMTPILLLASTLALSFPRENPSVNRLGALAPIVFAIAGLALARLLAALSAIRLASGGLLAVFVAALITLAAARENYVRYFHDYDRQYRQTVANTTEIAHAIRGGASVGVTIDDAYLIDGPFWLDVRNIGIALHDENWADTHTIRPGEPLPEQPAGRPLFFILRASDHARLAELLSRWPAGVITAYPVEEPVHAFLTYWVPAAPGASSPTSAPGDEAGA